MENEKPISAPAPANADSYGFQKIVAIIGGIVAVIGALTGLFSVLPPFTSQTIATITFTKKYFQDSLTP
jgi:hypothetical protein